MGARPVLQLAPVCGGYSSQGVSGDEEGYSFVGVQPVVGVHAKVAASADNLEVWGFTGRKGDIHVLEYGYGKRGRGHLKEPR